MKTLARLFTIGLCLSLLSAAALGRDSAEFRIGPAGDVTGTANGVPLVLEENFFIQIHAHEEGGLTYWSIYSQVRPNNHSDEWVAGVTAAWTGFAGRVLGPFGTVTYPGGEIEGYPTTQVVGGFPMENLLGEDVSVGFIGLDTVIHIGTGGAFALADFNRDGTVGTQDLFDFVAAWCAGDARVPDLFEFLGAWFGLV